MIRDLSIPYQLNFKSRLQIVWTLVDCKLQIKVDYNLQLHLCMHRHGRSRILEHRCSSEYYVDNLPVSERVREKRRKEGRRRMDIVATAVMLLAAAASSACVRADALRVLNINMWGLPWSEHNQERFEALAGRSQGAGNELQN